ncbi:bifunctional diguanylate cyclase/phosphodiesterase [Nocardioides sp. YIM 152588]|uniref:bifunctional diguanylate cyclase/phosphodiesterase n=1 Tax=Nocardioides sp. YIM 152588 TaxID=3158259 RepID=UPI0032E3FCA2
MPTSTPPGHQRRSLRRWFDTFLVVAAVSLLVLGGAAQGWDPPRWTPIGAIALAIVPVLIRFGMSIETPGGTLRVSSAPAVLFAYEVDGSLTFALMWSVVVFTSYVSFFGPRRGLGRAGAEVIGGLAMIAAAQHVSTALWPLDRVVVADAVFAAVVVALEMMRAGTVDVRRTLRGVRPRDAATVFGGFVLASALVVLMREAYDHSPSLATGSTAGACLLVFVMGQIVLVRLQAQTRGLEILSAAGAAMPWPGARIESMLLDLADEAVRAQRVELRDTPGDGHQMSVALPHLGYLVVTRGRGGHPFTKADRRLMLALARMAESSRTQALQQEQLRYQATTDELTGLHTYAHFRRRIDPEGGVRNAGRQVVFLFVDLDGFKRLNSTIGHLETDQVLAGIGRRIQQLPQDIRACRFGGDEFVFLSTAAEDDIAIQSLVAQVRAAIEQPLTIGEQVVQVHASVGIATSRRPEEPLDTVLRRAETRMRRAKHGRSAPLMKPRAEMMQHLLGPDGFSVAYQPMVSVQTGEVHGVEALIRVADRTFGQLSPLLVVDNAMRADLLDDLTMAILETAVPVVEQAGALLARRLTLAINIEFGQLREDNPLAAALLDATREHEVDLVLELSERAFDTWTDAHVRLAERLRAAGIGLAIDDFGAGYATFSLLNQWPWEMVKVDRSLVAGKNPAERRLLTHVTSLLDDLARPMTAEGIETFEQLMLVNQLGVRWAQGWWISPPLTAAALLAAVGSSPRFPIFAGAAPPPPDAEDPARRPPPVDAST